MVPHSWRTLTRSREEGPEPVDLLRRLLPTPSRERFAALAVAALRSAAGGEPVRFDAESFRVVVGEGESSRIVNLGNFFTRYRESWPWQRAGVLRRLLVTFQQAGQDLPASFAEVRDRLLPGIRDPFYFEALRLEAELDGQTAPAIPWQPIGDRLAVCLVCDFPETMGIVAAPHLERWGLGYDEALNIALAGLARRSTERLQAIAPGVYASPWQDEYDASRILLPEVLRGLEVDGDVVAVCPNRGFLIVTGSRDHEGLDHVLQYAESRLGQPGAASALPLRYAWPDWLPFVPDARHPVHERWQRLRTVELGSVYGQQKELLDRVLEARGEDVFVASHTAARHEASGRVFSYAVWGDGVDALLPRTDAIALSWDDDGGHEHLLAPWEAVERRCGELLEPTEHVPPRFRARRFPDPTTLAGLRLERLPDF